MRILHLHERTEIKGGAEVYIDQLNRLLPGYGYQSFWIGEDALGKRPVVALGNFIIGNNIDLISIHNVFNPVLVTYCLDRFPVVKFAHGPVMVCPGKDKFWRYSEKGCTIKYGIHCFKHIYTEGCANRHPKRVLKAWNNVNFEIKKASPRYRRIVVMSDFIKNGLMECGVNENKIICNPYFTPIAAEGANTPLKKDLLFVGRLISSKGPHIMLKAVEPILKSRNDVCLKIIGDGIMKNELARAVADLNLENKVSFLGWLDREKIGRILQESHLLIFPSIYPEAFGIVGIEAMMRGKPVVGFNVGGVNTWLKNEQTGFLVEPKDYLEMQNRIELLLNDAFLYNQFANEARKQAIDRFTVDTHMDILLRVYNEAMQ